MEVKYHPLVVDICRGEKRGTEDEMVGWHHPLNGHEFKQNPEDSEGQGNLACCSPWGCKESAMTKQLNNSNICVVQGSDFFQG